MERGTSSPLPSNSPDPPSSVTRVHAAKAEHSSNSNENNNVGVDDPPNVNKRVNITVQKEHTKDVTFSVKRTTELSKVMLNYYRHMGLSHKGLKFAYLGKQLKETDTPLSLNMEDDDVIDCFADQVGGRGRGRGRARGCGRDDYYY